MERVSMACLRFTLLHYQGHYRTPAFNKFGFVKHECTSDLLSLRMCPRFLNSQVECRKNQVSITLSDKCLCEYHDGPENTSYWRLLNFHFWQRTDNSNSFSGNFLIILLSKDVFIANNQKRSAAAAAFSCKYTILKATRHTHTKPKK